MSAKKNNRSLFPLLLMAAGVVFIISALLWVLNSADEEVASSSQPTNTLSAVTTRRIPYSSIKRVNLADAKEAFDLGAAVFVDTRGDIYFAEGHIPGALSIPENELLNRIGELDPADWIITYCT